MSDRVVPSYLSDSRYLYDFVVATTQARINVTMVNFLAGLTEPVASVCYVADDDGNPIDIDFAELLKNTNGSDPFSIPADANPSTSQDLKNLKAGRFMAGFRAQIGPPPASDDPSAPPPDIVVLGNNTDSVTFNMYCSTFQVVEYTPAGGYARVDKWLSVSQDPLNPWVFTSKVDLRLSPVDQSAYDKLPEVVQKKIMNLGPDAFSVQQLLFDLSNAALMSKPSIPSVGDSSDLGILLNKYFVTIYFQEMQKEGQPLLGCNVIAKDPPTSTLPDSTLKLTALNLEVNGYVDASGIAYPDPTDKQRQFATLCYLCATDGNPLPPPTHFNWNWVDISEEGDHDGVISINRNTFRDYIRSQLVSHVADNCYQPWVRLTTKEIIPPGAPYSIPVWIPIYDWGLTPGQTASIDMPSTGDTVLSYSWKSTTANDTSGLNGDLGELSLQNSFSLSVQFADKQITTTQRQVIDMSISRDSSKTNGKVVDLTRVDTYTLDIDLYGGLTTKMTTEKTDNSETPKFSWICDLFTDVNDVVKNIKSDLQEIAGHSFTSLPTSSIQDFVFPAGKTFTFKRPGFSAHQDLYSFITYVDPVSVATVPVAPSDPDEVPLA